MSEPRRPTSIRWVIRAAVLLGSIACLIGLYQTTRLRGLAPSADVESLPHGPIHVDLPAVGAARGVMARSAPGACFVGVSGAPGERRCQLFELEGRSWRPLLELPTDRGQQEHLPPGVAIDGRRWAALARGVLVLGIGDRVEDRIRCPLEVTALMLHGRWLLIGSPGAVHAVDLGDPRGEIHRIGRIAGANKPVDALVVVGDHLIAVDNIVSPKWGLVFALSDGDWPRHRFTDIMFQGVNAHVVGAVSADGACHVWVRFSAHHGHGSYLQRCRVVGNAFAEETSIGFTNLRDTPQDEERWQGVAAAADGLAIAADAQGLIWLPTPGQGNSQAGTLVQRGVDLGAPCLDVTAAGARLVALVGSDQARELVVLEAAGGRLREVGRGPAEGVHTLLP